MVGDKVHVATIHLLFFVTRRIKSKQIDCQIQYRHLHSKATKIVEKNPRLRRCRNKSRRIARSRQTNRFENRFSRKCPFIRRDRM